MAALSQDEALEEVRKLERKLLGRIRDIEKYQDYYDGKHKLHYASSEFREWFEGRYQGFADNWCAPVVDATVERLKIEGVRPHGASKVDKGLQKIFEENQGQVESKLAFTASAIAGRAFAIVWGSDDGPELTFEHPAQCVVEYEPGSRRKRKSALKLWQDDKHLFATLYTPDHVWKFQRDLTNLDDGYTRTLWVPAAYGDWEPRQPNDEPWPLSNPMGIVPMVELQNRPKLNGDPLNEISGVAAMQDAINMLWSYLFTAGDFAALPQRIVLGAQLPKLPILDENGRKVGEKPIDLPEANVKRILNFEGPDAKIGQWDSADLEVFTTVIEKAVGHVASQTRTPAYYFANKIENISGDTLQALDAGLVSKIHDRMMFYDYPILEIYSLLALANNNPSKAKAIKSGTVMWADSETRSDAQKMDGLVKLQNIGFPFAYIAEQFTGGDADETERIIKMRDKEQEEQLAKQQEQMAQQQADGTIPAGAGASKGGSGGAVGPNDAKSAAKDNKFRKPNQSGGNWHPFGNPYA